ncbi:MAG: glycosyltransferase family 9 protein, partial [bacterium]
SSGGDVILATSVVEALKNSFPDAEIDFLVKEEYAPILYENPAITRIIHLKKSERGLYPFVIFVSSLRKNNYNLIVDLHKNFRSFMIKSMLSDTKKVVTKKNTLNRFILVRFKKRIKEPARVVELHLESLKQIGINSLDYRPKLYLSEMEIAKATALFPFDSLVIGIHPFARWKNKEWGLKRYLELARRFVSTGAEVIFFGKCNSVLKGVKVVEPKDWRELMMFIYRCDLFIGNDSAPVHIANAFNIPVIAIFGPTSPEFGFAPCGDNVRIMYKGVKCSPCSLHGEKKCKNELVCMSSISVDDVFKKGVELLNGFKKSRFH